MRTPRHILFAVPCLAGTKFLSEKKEKKMSSVSMSKLNQINLFCGLICKGSDFKFAQRVFLYRIPLTVRFLLFTKFDSKSATIKASRYVDMMGVFWKWVLVHPPGANSVFMLGMLESAMYSEMKRKRNGAQY